MRSSGDGFIDMYGVVMLSNSTIIPLKLIGHFIMNKQLFEFGHVYHTMQYEAMWIFKKIM